MIMDIKKYIFQINMYIRFTFTKYKGKIIKRVIRALQPGAERFYSANGKLLVVSPGRYYHCNICLSKAVRSEIFDAFACLKCNDWLEDKCSDRDCNLCGKDRPTLPSECEDL
jgi:hypothetical protein